MSEQDSTCQVCMDNFTGGLNFFGENILREFFGGRIVEQTAKIRTL